MNVHNFSQNPSILQHFIAQLRDVDIQNDSLRFRRNLERVGEILSYELSKELTYGSKTIQTPLGEKKMSLGLDDLVLCSILRAGLPLHQGILNYFDGIENAFISAFRRHQTDIDFDIVVEYLAAPALDDKILILADPMLATGSSLVAVYKALQKTGNIKQIHLVSVIAATEGIEYIKPYFPENTHLWVAAVDDQLNDHGYIIPGLGDAGDLAFGPKL